MKEEAGGKRAKATEVIDGEGNEGNVLGVKSRDDISTLGRVRGTALEFRADAGQVSPEDQGDGRVGLLGEAAGNVRDGNVDANRDGGGGGGGEEINHDIQRAALRVVRESVLGFALDIVGGTSQARKRGKKLENSIEGIPDVVMKGWFAFLGETTGEEVIAMRVTTFGTEGAGGGKVGVKERETELPAEEEAVGIVGEAMVRETTGKGMHRDAGSRREEGGEDVEGSRVQSKATLKEFGSG